jgi:hypothetical protein
LVLICSSGSSCRQWSRTNDPLAPIAFTAPPTLEQIIYEINANSAKVRQLSSDSAFLSTAGAPTALRATLALERPMHLRLRGRLVVQELDLGSNHELLWFWAKSDPEQALYYAYHEQFIQGATNSILPVGPDWIIEAIGLVSLDPSGWHDGPAERPDGGYEIRSRFDRGGMAFTRVLIIDGKYGWIREQHVLDTAGRLLAIARCSNHRHYADPGVTLPHRIDIELPPAQMGFQLEVSNYAVNRLPGDPAELFSPPLNGYRMVNLAQQPPVAAPPNSGARSIYAPQPTEIPHTAYRLRYRGYGGNHGQGREGQ